MKGMKKKRLLAALLSLVMVVSLLPVAALAAETEKAPLFFWGFEADEAGTAAWTVIDNNADNHSWDIYRPADDEYPKPIGGGAQAMQITGDGVDPDQNIHVNYVMDDMLVSPVIPLPADKTVLTLTWGAYRDGLRSASPNYQIYIYEGTEPLTAENVATAAMTKIDDRWEGLSGHYEPHADLTAYAGKSVQLVFHITDLYEDVLTLDDITITDAPFEMPGVVIGNTPLTPENADDLVYSGSARYDKETRTLFLENAVIYAKGAITVNNFNDGLEEDGFNGIWSQGDLTINLKGSNYVVTESRDENSTSDDSYAIWVSDYPDSTAGSLTICGDGSLHARASWVGDSSSSDAYGIKVDGLLTIQDSAKVRASTPPAAGDDSYGVQACDILLKDHAELRTDAETGLDDDSVGIHANGRGQAGPDGWHHEPGKLGIQDDAKLYASSGDAEDDSDALRCDQLYMKDRAYLEATGGGGVDDGERVDASEIYMAGDSHIVARQTVPCQDYNRGVNTEYLFMKDNARIDAVALDGDYSRGIGFAEGEITGNAQINASSTEGKNSAGMMSGMLKISGKAKVTVRGGDAWGGETRGICLETLYMNGGSLIATCGTSKIASGLPHPVAAADVYEYNLDPEAGMVCLTAPLPDGANLVKYDYRTEELTDNRYFEIRVCRHDQFCPTQHLLDNNPRAWYHGAVDYAVENGFMTGLNATSFGPDYNAIRQDVVLVLWNMAGNPAPKAPAPFTDLGNSYAKDAIAWAYENGIVSGMTDTTFAPKDAVSRRDFMMMLHAYAILMDMPSAVFGDLTDFTDADKCGYAAEAMRWAVGFEIISGKTDTLLAPKDTMTRAELAAFLTRLSKLPTYIA